MNTLEVLLKVGQNLAMANQQQMDTGMGAKNLEALMHLLQAQRALQAPPAAQRAGASAMESATPTSAEVQQQFVAAVAARQGASATTTSAGVQQQFVAAVAAQLLQQSQQPSLPLQQHVSALQQLHLCLEQEQYSTDAVPAPVMPDQLATLLLHFAS